jgi:hypothetical protein
MGIYDSALLLCHGLGRGTLCRVHRSDQ